LTILSYTIEKNGVEYLTNHHPSLVTFIDTQVGSIGEQITYRVKAVNEAGSSAYS